MSLLPATELLRRVGDGDGAAVEELLPLVYDELRAVAGKRFGAERNDHTLQPTALVHEVYLRMIDQDGVRYHDRSHFFALAARMMRRVLVDHARTKRRQKRGGGWNRVTLSGGALTTPDSAVDAVIVDDLLTELTQLNERQGKIAELRVFAELELAEIAQCLDVSVTTVKDDWRAARAWLKFRLSETDPE